MSLFDSYVRGYLKERLIQFDKNTATDDDCAALLIANVDLPSFVNLLDRLAERCCRSWNVGNDGQRTERERDLANRNHAELKKVIEQLAALFDIQVDWPGLYPSFTFNGYGYHTPLSVMREVMALRQPNADRIAKAAPTMLRALKNVQTHLAVYGDPKSQNAILCAGMVANAIAEAEGPKQ